MLLAIRALADNDRGPRHLASMLQGLVHGTRTSLTLLYGTSDGRPGLFVRCADHLAGSIRSRLLDAYPTVTVQPVPEFPEAALVDRTRIVLSPDVWPIRTFEAFEDQLERVLVDPVTGLLNRVQRTGRGAATKACVAFTITPARRSRTRVARRAVAFVKRVCPLPVVTGWMHRSMASASALDRWIGWPAGLLARRTEVDCREAERKLDEHLFEVGITVSVTGPREARRHLRRRRRELMAALAEFTSERARFQPTWRGCRSLMSAREIATLWHPPTGGVRVDRLAMSPHRELPPPNELPRQGTVIGRVAYRGRRNLVRLPVDDCRRHVGVLGRTGVGKSTLLLNVMVSHLQQGRNVVLVDPHGDLAEALIDRVPRRRTGDVVLLDPADTVRPVVFNPLTVHPGANPTLVADGVLTAFTKVFGLDESSTPRLLHILRNGLLALVESKGATLFALQRLLVDEPFRRTIVNDTTNPAVRSFFRTEFDHWSSRDRTQYVASLQNKLGAFTTNPTLQAILGRPRGTVDLRAALDRGCLVANLSKGRIGEDASRLLGALLVSTLQVAAMGRADVPEPERPDAVIVVDEFQNFTSTGGLSVLLSEGRKFRTSLVLATQFLAQVEPGTLDALFGNVGTLVSFGVGASDAEVLAEQLAGEATPRDLVGLPKYHAYVRATLCGTPHPAFSMTTLPPPEIKESRSEVVRRVSRRRHGRALGEGASCGIHLA